MDKELIKEVRRAIQENKPDIVKNLVDENKELLSVTTPFGTFLHDAASYGMYDIAKYLVESGIDVNTVGGVGRKSNALTKAAFEGYLNIVELLYENGATFDVSTFDANPLFAAIYNNHIDVVKFLVEKGIDLKPCYAVGDYDALNACDYAEVYGRSEIVEYLKSKM